MNGSYLLHLPDGTEYGPVDRATLAAWHAEGRLPDDTLVWPEGAPEWLLLTAVLGDTATTALHIIPEPAPSTPLPAAAAPALREAPAIPAGGAAGASGRMRVRPSPGRPPVAAAPAFPLQRVLIVSGAALVALVLLAGLWSVARPWLSRRSQIAAVEQHALPDRRVEDREAGLVVDLPAGWVALRAGNPYVSDADARLRLARPSLPAFASVSMAVRPRLMDALDAHLDALLQERLPRQPSTKETGRADVQLGRGRGRLVRTTWEDGLVPMQGAIVAWADGYDLFTLVAWAEAKAGGAFAEQVESLCRGVTPTGVLGKRVDDAVERLALEVPELSQEALRLLVAERMSQGLGLEDVPQAALVLVSRGLEALAPAEASEMRAIYQQVWAPVPEAQRVRLAALLAALKAGREVPPEDVAQVREAVKVGVLALPQADRERLQALSGRAVRKSLLVP
jgi:hypothetical protein